MANSLRDVDLDALVPNQELIDEMRARFDRAEEEKQKIYRQIEQEMSREARPSFGQRLRYLLGL